MVNHALVTTDLYYSASWQVLETFAVGQSGGQPAERYVYSPVYVDALVLRDRDTDANGIMDERLYVTQDANYNVTSIVTTGGGVAERFVYSAYGVRTDLDEDFAAAADSKGFVEGWQGLRWDSAIGMFSARNRWYSPTLMTWISWDPMGYPNGLNTYAVEAANPINRVDPEGLLERDANGRLIVYNAVRNPLKRDANGKLITSTVASAGKTRPHGGVLQGQVILIDDAGNPIVAWVTLDPNANGADKFDCHGYSFGDSEVWIDDDQASKILRDEYDSVPAKDVRLGDVAAYSLIKPEGNYRAGALQHSGVVSQVVADDGKTRDLRISGKAGDLLERPLTKDPPGPGPYTYWEDTNTTITYYRYKPPSTQPSSRPASTKP